MRPPPIRKGGPVSEIAYITLKPEVDFQHDANVIALWDEAKRMIAVQKGYGGSYQGTQFEDPSILIWVIFWENYESHQNFKDDPSYLPFKAKLAPLMDAVHFHHMKCEPTVVIRRAPCTEVATFHDCEESMLQNVEKFAQVIDAGKPDGYLGNGVGQVIEKIVRHKDIGNDEAKKGSAVMLLIGWESKEQHLRFRETELFKENIWLLREKNGGAEMDVIRILLSTIYDTEQNGVKSSSLINATSG